MNGTLSTYFTFWHAIIAFLVVVFGAVAVKISLTFDLNTYLESRRESYKTKLMNACTHVALKPLDDGLQGKVLFTSPPGTVQWQCQRCGLVRYLERDESDEMIQYWMGHIDEYHKRNKLFRKLLKKSGQV